jgi:branched-chain amino acid transport system substrate-binding protein
MKSRKKYFLAAAIGILSACLFLSGRSFAQDTIKMGVVVPLTGSFADEGTEMVRGVELMVDKINAGGGLLGKKLEMIIGDIGDFSGEKIVSVAEKLKNRDKVAVFITQYLGGVVDVKTFGEFDIPYVNMDTSSLEANAIMENRDKYANIFQACPPETYYGDGIFDFLTRVYPKATGYAYPNKKIALVTMVRGYNDRISARFRGLVDQSDWEIVVDEKTPTGTVEWGPVLTKIRKENPAIIFFNDHVPSDEVSFLDQFHNNPTKSVIFIQYGPSNPAFINLGQEKSNDIFWGTVYAGFGPQYEEWKKRYVEKYKEEPGVGTAAGTYTSSMIWAQAVQRAKDERNYEEVCRNIREYPFNITGPLHVFDPHNQTAILGEGLSPFLVYQIQDRQQQLVSPVPYATAEIKVPMWLK